MTNLLTVFFVVLIDLLGFGIVLPLIPYYASRFQASALVIGFLYSIYSFSQLIFSPVWGSFSDRIGRRPIMLLSTLGASLAYLLFAFSNSLGMLFLSRLLAGIMGGNISTAQAYIADVTTSQERARGMGLIGAAFGIGFTAGPALATVLLRFGGQNPYKWPGLFAAFLSFLSFLCVFFFLPETVKKSSRDLGEKINKPSVFKKEFWSQLSAEKQNRLLQILLFCVFLLSFAQSSLYSAFPLFCKGRLDLPPEKVGVQLAYMGFVAILIQGIFIRVLEKAFGEKKLFLWGNVLLLSGLFLIPFSQSEKGLMLNLTLMGIGGSLSGPTLNSLISKQAEPSRMGQALGTSQGLSALGRAVGPAWGGALFGISFRMPFMITAALASATIYFAWKIQK